MQPISFARDISITTSAVNYFLGGLPRTFSKIAAENGDTALLCCSSGSHTSLNFRNERPGLLPFVDERLRRYDETPHIDVDLVFSQNHFAFLFEFDRSATGPSLHPNPPVSLRPFVDGVAIAIEDIPSTNMPGSRNLFGSELTGPRGVFVSKQSMADQRRCLILKKI